MDSFLRDITELRLVPIEASEQLPNHERVVDGSFLLTESEEVERIKIKRGDRPSQIVYIHTSSQQCERTIELESGSNLSIVEVLCSGSDSTINFVQSRDSQLNSTVVRIGDGELNYTVALNGEGCESRVDLLQLTTLQQAATSNIRIEHNSANCTSKSSSKAIAGGESTNAFNGMVYVAKDAQRSEAEQNSRNIALSSGAKIVAEPQLEIYADDVKCSHGATIGEMNHDAIFYMRQRGLSEDQARKVQLEGFASQIAQFSPIEEIREALTKLISDHLSKL